MAADNTRKTSNIIHTVDGIKSDVNNLSQNIENNTESIGNIKVYDSHIWLSTSKGLTVTQDGNTTTNNEQPTEWKLEADTNYLNTTLNFAKSDEIPSVYVKDIKSGDITTLTVAEKDGVYTLTAIGGGGGGGIDNITLAEGTCIKIDSEQYDDNGTTKTRLTINTDTDCLNTTLNFAKPTDIGDGNITLKSTDNTVSITGANATANQATDTAWDLSVNIPTPPTPGDGNITLTEGDGIKVSGADATANQTSDTAWTVKTDNDYLNANLNFAKPGDIPTDLGVLTIENITPHADGNFDFKSSDAALVVGNTAHGLSLSIDEDELDFVKEIKSGNELTLTVDDDGNGTVTLTAAGGGGGGAGDIAFAGGKCINVDPETVGDLTTYTINNDLDCLNSSLGFATDQDITDAIGNITIPEKTSDLVNDGEGTDPFITAADLPDGTLPISSTDGTVTLDSPSANTFTVSTGGEERVKVSDDKTFVDNRLLIGSPSVNAEMALFHVDDTEWTTSQPHLYGLGHAVIEVINFQQGKDGVYAGYSMSAFRANGVEQSAFLGVVSRNSTEGVGGDVVLTARSDGTEQIELLRINNEAAVFNGQVQTPSVSGVADNDASIELGAGVTIDANQFTPLTLTNDKDGLLIRTINKDGRQYWHGQDASGWCVSTRQVVDGVAQAIRSFGVTGDYEKPDWRVYAGGFQADNWLKSPQVSGVAENDASIELGAGVTVSTGGEERVKVKPASYGSAAVTIGEDHVQSIGGVSVKNDPTQVDYTSQMQMRFVDENGKYAYTGCTEPRFAFGGANALIDGGVFFAGHDNGNSVLFSKTDDVIIATGGLAASSERLRITDDAAVFNGQVQTNTITSKDAASGDASIELGANLTVSTGGSQSVIVTDDGRVGFGATPASSVQFQLTGSNSTGMRTDLLHNSATRYQNSDGQLMVTTADGTSNIAVMSGFRIVGKSNAGATVDQYWGVYVAEVPALAVGAGGVRTAINGDGADEGKASVSGVFNVYADGNAPSYFGGEVRITPTAQLNVNKIVGATAPATDASIALGAELLTTNHTPTQPNSIATRQFVLDQAGAAGLVPMGAPSDDTTPDSPNGSTLHDDLYLYVKGSTSWKKTALYPLDSSGGGSEFPLPQPGDDSGIAWETESVNLAFSQPGYGECGAAVGVAGNAFFAGNAWSVDGSQWFRVQWNGTTSGSYGVCDATSRTPAYGNGLYTGRYGYSYDGQSWTTYPNGGVFDETRECFFFQNKHYSMGGSRFFDGQLKANTNPNILGNIKNSAFVVPSNEGPSQTCLAINYNPPSGTNSLTLTDEAKRNVLLKFSGDMSTTGTWSQLQVEGSAIQTCYGLAHNDLDDKYCFITNNTSYVQKTAGNFTSSGWTKTTLPTTGEWAGLVHDGTHYVAVGIASGANISIYSEDGIAWSQSTTLSNPGVNTIAGFNGRVLAAGNLTSSDLAQILVTGNPTVTFTTKNIPLDHPVDVADSYMAQQYQMKETQADANELFTEEIQRRSPVMTLTQVEYDAIPADEIDDNTLYLITS